MAELSEMKFERFYSPAGIRCPKCGMLLTTTIDFEAGAVVKCTNFCDSNFKNCGFVGEVGPIPVGVNIIP